ncbi:hypothetical protein E8E13_002875 [Curvularia kusanoi]|uniref:Uncharacterized protein n=1 Tax=Curvularia kusanoi TaxID=90978 RepID=A0A9P4W253_CURKU|nr:hypothetical protein E8E13_002875 [Curvularia kusanoi]
MDRLSPGWISRPLSRRKKSPDSRPTSANSQLSPQRSVSRRSSNSNSNSNDNDNDSRPSSRSGSRSIRGMVSRIRSVSNASRPKTPNQEVDLKEIDEWFTGFQRYNQLVSTIPQPNITPEFSKACKQLSKNCGGNFIHSLPEALFDLALLWCPTSPSTSTNLASPSWSWTSQTEPVNFPFDPTTSPDTYTLPRSSGPTFRSEIQNFHIGPVNDPYTIRRDKHNTSVRIQYPPYFHAPRGSDPKAESEVLRFTAQTIPADGFSANQLHYRDQEIPCSQLIDPQGHHAGVLMAHESSISAPHYSGPYEFVLLSRNKRVQPAEGTGKPKCATMHPPGTPIWAEERFVWDQEVVDFDEEVFKNAGEWCVVNVMLIRWDESRGHAERVAVGRMHEDAWGRLGAMKREVVLV